MWFRVDDSFSNHPKVLAVPRKQRAAVIGLWTLAGSWCAYNETDGALGHHMVEEFCATKTHADALVKVGLWEETPDGYVFHDWEQWQFTQAEITARSEAKAEAGRRGGRASGRSRREAKPKQVLHEIEADASPDGSNGEAEGQANPNENEAQSQSQSRSYGLGSQSSPVVGSTRDDLDLAQIERATGGDLDHADRVASEILSRAKGEVRDPTGFVLKAIGNEPLRYRAPIRAPVGGEACADHPGQWRTNCGGCAADRKAAS